jgi:hypothetical protein
MRKTMNDPIQVAEQGVAALRVFEEIAKRVGDGRIKVTVHAGGVTSIVVEQRVDVKTLPPANARIIAEMATILGYGGFEFPIKNGRIEEMESVERKKHVA